MSILRAAPLRTHMSNLAEEIRDELTQAAADDALELPTLPEVALKIRDTAEDPDVSVGKLAQVISEDPVLAAQVVKGANSPMFRGTQAIEDITMAVGRMGVEYAANLATGLAMQHMFQATSEVVDAKLRSIWNHATDVAAIAGVLATSLTSLRADQAALAGLTHSIGALPVLAFAEEHDDLIQDEQTLDRVIAQVQAPLGTMILQHWHFPEELVKVPAQINDFDRDAPAADYIDITQVACLQAVAGTDDPLTELDWSTVTAFPRLGLNAEQARETLTELAELFQMSKDVFG